MTYTHTMARRDDVDTMLNLLREEAAETYYFMIVKHLDDMFIRFGLTATERAELMLAIATKCAERRGKPMTMPVSGAVVEIG